MRNFGTLVFRNLKQCLHSRAGVVLRLWAGSAVPADITDITSKLTLPTLPLLLLQLLLLVGNRAIRSTVIQCVCKGRTKKCLGETHPQQSVP